MCMISGARSRSAQSTVDWVSRAAVHPGPHVIGFVFNLGLIRRRGPLSVTVSSRVIANWD